jgi:hypothetical protein
MAEETDEQRQERLSIYYNVFGPQPPTTERWVKGNEAMRGIRVVYRELLYDEWIEVSRVVTRESASEMQDVIRTQQLLSRSIDSTDEKEWPEDLKDRLDIVGHWRASVVTVMSQSWVDFWTELQGQAQVLREDPNFSGGSDGPSSKRRGAGGIVA